MNDSEREQWVQNDEGLYRWWRSTRQSLRTFVRSHRVEIQQHAERVMGGIPTRTWPS